MVNSKKVSIIFMMSLAIALIFMDVKDLYYKIAMCGPEQTWSFNADFNEKLTDTDLTQFIKNNNGTWIAKSNMWNALAMQCDSLVPFKMVTRISHMTALGTGCNLNGVKRMEPVVFAGIQSIDSLVWGFGLLADIVRSPYPSQPYPSTVFAETFGIPEASYRDSLAAMIDKDDVAAINSTAHAVFDAFGTRLDLWFGTLCYELVTAPDFGQSVHGLIPEEYGCIWSDQAGDDLHMFHVGKDVSKYFRAISEWKGMGWMTLDYLHVSNLFLRARLHSNTRYDISNTAKGVAFQHVCSVDLGIDGVLYYAMLAVEVLIITINSSDAWVVALLVVRPLLTAIKPHSAYMSTVTSTAEVNGTKTEKSGKDDDMNGSKAKQDETLSKILLYTDLTCVAFRKRLLAILLVVDAIFSWLYIVPNSTVYAWSTNVYQIGSAYLSNFRVWTVVVVLIDFGWRWTFVLVNERFAALITELTYISSFEIMLSTLVAVYFAYEDLLNVCLIKWGFVDRQRIMTPTIPGLFSYYNTFGRHSYGDRSYAREEYHTLYDPLFKIIFFAMLFSVCIIVLRLVANVSTKAYRGTLRKDVASFWRTYQRNSVEVFMNDPLRAKALVRSQAMMSYRFGRSVFIRPFVYLEQNYYIYRGKFRRRPLFPLIDNSDFVNGAEVNFKGYQLEGVYHDEESKKIRKKRVVMDTQVPLC